MGNDHSAELSRERERRREQEREIRRLEALNERTRKEDLERQRELEEEMQALRLQQREEEDAAERRRRYLEPLKQPWRTISSKWEDPWTKEFKEELLRKICTIRANCGVGYINILLLGQAASGKSSFANTCLTAIYDQDRLVTSSTVYQESTTGVTTTFETFPINTRDGKTLPVRLFDCRGLHVKHGVPTEDIRAIVKGHVKSGYKINPMAAIGTDDPKYRKNPGIKDCMHCIVYVADAGNPVGNLMDGMVADQIRYVRDNLATQHLPQIVLFNKIDKLHISNRRNLQDIFRSQDVRDTCTKAAEYMQMPLTNVFPMSNYCNESIPTLEKDILALFSLLNMMQRGNDYITRLSCTKDAPADFYD